MARPAARLDERKKTDELISEEAVGQEIISTTGTTRQPMILAMCFSIVTMCLLWLVIIRTYRFNYTHFILEIASLCSNYLILTHILRLILTHRL